MAAPSSCVDRNEYNLFLDLKFPPAALCAVRPTSKTIRRQKGEKIVRYLTGTGKAEGFTATWVRMKRFEVKQFPKLGFHDVLYQSCEEENRVRWNSKTKSKSSPARSWKKSAPSTMTLKRVAFVEDFYNILLEAHTQTLNHGGYKPLLKEVSGKYSCLPRSAVQAFVQMCKTCQQRTRNKLTPLNTVNVKGRFNERCQISCIDMSSCPNGQYHWIGHYVDHWSSYHILFPLVRNSPSDLAFALQTSVFPYFGPPRILQSDGSEEFLNQIVQECHLKWNGGTTSEIARGEQCDSRSRKHVEKWNGKIKKIIQKIAQEQNTESEIPWCHWLGQIMFDVNCRFHKSTGRVPYEMVFAQLPNGVNAPEFSREEVVGDCSDDGLSEEGTKQASS